MISNDLAHRAIGQREPRVSVIMPAYNAARHLRDAVDSVLGQTFHHLELIVVDDASTDATSQILASYSDARLQVIRHPQNQGISTARNHAAEVARGELLAFHDADDVSLPERLALQVAYLDQHPDVDLLGTEYVRIDDEGQLIRAGTPRPTADAQLKWALLFANQFTNSSVVVRRAAFDRAGGCRIDRPYAEDYGLWSRIAQFGKLAALPRALVQYRVHPQGVSQTQSRTQREIVHRISTDLLQRIAPPSFDAAHIALLQMLVVGDPARLSTFSWSSEHTRQLDDIVAGTGELLDRFRGVYVRDASTWPAAQRWARRYIAQRLLRTAAAWSYQRATRRLDPVTAHLCVAALRIDVTLLSDRGAIWTAARAMLRRRKGETASSVGAVAGSTS